MRHALVLALFAAMAAAQQPAQVAGRVIDSKGRPVPRATVTLQTNGPARLDSPWNSYTQTTQDDGGFVFTNAAPDNYRLRAERLGYLLRGLEQLLTLREGTKAESITVVLAEQAVISGRVTGPEGDPVEGMVVRAARYAYVNGQRMLQARVDGATNDQGIYRIPFLEAGSYFVYADPQGKPTLSPDTVDAGAAWIGTYFPGTTDLRRAELVEVSAGEEAQAAIRMSRVPAYSIRGTVLFEGKPLRGVLMIIPDPNEAKPFPGGPPPVKSQSTLPFLASARTNAQGKFELHNVPAGLHILRAMPGDRMEVAMPGMVVTVHTLLSNSSAPVDQNKPSGRMQVTVTNASVDGVVLNLTRSAEISGRLEFDGTSLEEILAVAGTPPAGSNLPPRIPTVRLAEAATISLQGSVVAPEAAGRFRVTQLSAGRYWITPVNVPAPYYVKSVRYGDADISRSPLEFTGGPGELVVTIAKGTGTLTGTVKNEKDEPVRGITVSVWPKTPNRSSSTGGVLTVTTDQFGAFQLDNVIPDQYNAAAFETLPQPGLDKYPEFLALFAGEAGNLSVQPNGKAETSLRMIPAARAAAAELP